MDENENDENNKAKNEIINFFFHTKEKSEITKISNDLSKCIEQTEYDFDKELLEDFLINLREFRPKKEKYDFYSSIANLGLNSNRSFRIYLEKLTSCFLDLDKNLKNQNSDLNIETNKNVQSFINQYIELLHLYLDLYSKIQETQKQIKAINDETTNRYEKIISNENNRTDNDNITK